MSMEILDFSSSTGHRVFITTPDLPRFRDHVAHMSADEREWYAPLALSGEQPVPGGAHFFIGRYRTHAEVMNLLTHVVIDH